jgi:hypothetical protein
MLRLVSAQDVWVVSDSVDAVERWLLSTSLARPRQSELASDRNYDEETEPMNSGQFAARGQFEAESQMADAY